MSSTPSIPHRTTKTSWNGSREPRGREGAQVTVDPVAAKSQTRYLEPSWRLASSSGFTRILPASSNAKDDARLIVSIQCAATRFRRAAYSNIGAGRWRGEIEIRRRTSRHCSSPSTLGSANGHSYVFRGWNVSAGHLGAVIAEGRDLALAIDESQGNRWRDQDAVGGFQQSTRFMETRALGRFVSSSPMVPTLNVAQQSIRSYARRSMGTSHGTDAAVRHANALLAQTAWVQLCPLRSEARDDSLETVEAPPEGWKKGVIARFLPRLYPDTPEGDRLARAVEELRSPDQIGSLMSIAGTGAQEVMASYRLVESAIRAAERVKGEES